VFDINVTIQHWQVMGSVGLGWPFFIVVFMLAWHMLTRRFRG
jgi:hypothetical protein